MANQGYIRYSDTAGIATSPQPLSTPGTIDPGTGWETKPYLNFNGDYKKFDDNGVDVTASIQPYERRDDNGVVVPVEPYARHNDDNDPIV